MGYKEESNLVLEELNEALHTIREEEVEQLVDMICSARKVFVVGVGRVLLMLQAFTKRLNHLGIEANYVGAIDEPAITDQDLLIVGSGSGSSIVPLEIMKIAKKYNAKIAHIGSNVKSPMSEYEDLFLRIPCKTKLDLQDEIDSKQVMSSLFEQSLLLLADSVALMIVEKKQIKDIHALWEKHANLE
ncbi:MAG: SIS domain-containing protein [Anaerostipes sp.]|nr:SIS domain-containing protein [Anaerostipes sp.]MDD3746678.1 SIS domain-containing protein [Anaerostipes sp.]